ncbi:hypothetical protein BDV96DRAFT_156474 [Lophiotrema nucula]|uniref:Uncharacterized protein n=1 Tax=Lophiotrema nucula TaxID=690887 RepID=A0A6A5YZW9_9PLEO|nr:hypothetical protein BDV96DRAFT_156474 [Lophiotrema nucula]
MSGRASIGIGSIGQLLGYVSSYLSILSSLGAYPIPIWGISGVIGYLFEDFPEYGIGAVFLHLVPEAREVVDKVKKHVLHAEDEEIIAFLKSYTSSFNMTGVAGAIVAQIAVTGLSLTRLEDSHWTAEAFFVISLVTGVLSVYFSCLMSPAFNGLHSAENIKEFLSKTISRREMRIVQDVFAEVTKRKRPSKAEIAQLEYRLFEPSRQVPSVYAAVMLVVPMSLLTIALNTFLVGLGIYLGKLYTANLIPSYGKGSLGILIIYILTTLHGIGLFYSPQSLKAMEAYPLKRLRKFLETAKKNAPDEHIHLVDNATSRHEDGPEQQQQASSARQSIHSRKSGNRVSYEIAEPHGKDASAAEHVPEGQAPELQTAPEPNAALADAETSSAPHEPRKPDIHDIKQPEDVQAPSVQEALNELVRAQQESLRASQRLSEAFRALKQGETLEK